MEEKDKMILVNKDTGEQIEGDKIIKHVKSTDLSYIQSTQTLVGQKKRELIDAETGERIFVDQITKRVYGTKHFWKVYLMDFLTVLGVIDSKQLNIFIYILENINSATNLFIGTYDKIARDCCVSKPTIVKIMKKLQENDFITKVQNGVYEINPGIMMKGNDTKRQILLNYYESDEPINEITFNRTKRPPYKTDDVKSENNELLLEGEKDNNENI